MLATELPRHLGKCLAFTFKYTILKDRSGLKGIQAADMFTERYKSHNNITISKDSKREPRTELQAAKINALKI